MQNIYVMVGLPGSGKSTKAEQISLRYHASIISSDAIREQLFGDENNQEHNQEVFSRYYEIFQSFLKDGHNIVLDATNINIKARKHIFLNIEDYLRKNFSVNERKEEREKIHVVAYVMSTPVEECMRRDSKREHPVYVCDPDVYPVIDAFLRSFQFPQKYEGFDEIAVEGYGEADVALYDQRMAYDIMNRMAQFDQKTPYHKFTLLKHCTILESLCMKDPIMKVAGLWHDVGKLLTQRIDDNGVAHYFNHDSVGTYYLLDKLSIFGLSDWDNIFEVLFYINFHMKAHRDLRNSKAERRYRALFGDDRYEKLIDFANRDMIASGTFDEHS